ncbi:MAG: Hsp20/alpha crystallin family protein [Isosphaeraceae bacterium]
MTELKEAPKPKTTNGPSTVKETVPSPKPAAPAISGGSPFAFMRRFTEEMDRLFEDFGIESRVHFPSLFTRGRELVRRETGLVPAAWSPRIDVVERDGQYVVRADLPGLARDDVKVEITHDSVLIQGERKTQKKEEVEGCTYSECSYGSFYRAIPLPAGSESSQATAEFTNGVLEIVVPCSRPIEPKKRRLEIKGGK